MFVLAGVLGINANFASIFEATFKCAYMLALAFLLLTSLTLYTLLVVMCSRFRHLRPHRCVAADIRFPLIVSTLPYSSEHPI